MNKRLCFLFILCFSAERRVNFVTSHYHVEDYVSVQSIPQNDYGRLLHFILMPTFSAHHRFFFREIARLSELTVIFYRLRHEDESAMVSCTQLKRKPYMFLVSVSENTEFFTPFITFLQKIISYGYSIVYYI